jgi:hypothetical protein
MCSQQHLSFIAACSAWFMGIACPAGICIGWGAGVAAGWPATSAAAVINMIMIQYS